MIPRALREPCRNVFSWYLQGHLVLSDRCKHLLDLDWRHCTLPYSSNGVNHLLVNSPGYEHISWPRSFKVRSKPSAAWLYLHCTAPSWSLLEQRHCSDRCPLIQGPGSRVDEGGQGPAHRPVIKPITPIKWKWQSLLLMARNAKSGH